MTEWIDAFAETIGVLPLTASETDRLLEASRAVAHRTERKATPLAAFLMGMDVASRISEGTGRHVAFDDALETLLRALPASDP